MAPVIDPVTRLAIAVLISVVTGTFTLAAVAILRRQQETRYFHGVNRLIRNYGPIVKKILSGTRSSENIGALRSLAIPDLELLLEPYSSRGTLRPYQVNALEWSCTEIGLIAIWRRRRAGAPRRRTPVAACSALRPRPAPGRPAPGSRSGCARRAWSASSRPSSARSSPSP